MISTCLWFNSNAMEAVKFYLSVFRDSNIYSIDYYTEVGEEITGHKKGDIVTIEFELNKTKFMALNAGPEFKFTPAVSFIIECETQEEIDYYWMNLSNNPNAEQCGWLEDKYGISWQVVPKVLNVMLKEGTSEQRTNITKVYMDMKKFEIEPLIRAYSSGK